MNLTAFLQSLKEKNPPDTSVYLKALWYDANGNWKAAHDLVNDMVDKKAAWLHAYLHRKEGDLSNAGYWYARAGKKRPDAPLDEEWQQLTETFLNEEGS